MAEACGSAGCGLSGRAERKEGGGWKDEYFLDFPGLPLCKRRYPQGVQRRYQAGRGRVDTITDKNGEQVDALETVATSRKDETEPAVVSPCGAGRVVNGRDEKDRMIIEGIRDGYLSKEIARMIGISEAAVCKRLKKIKADLLASDILAA